MTALLLLSLALAQDDPEEQAAPVRLAWTLGAEVVADDPFLTRRGLRTELQLRPLRYAAVSVGVAGYPILGDADYTALTRQLIEENQLSPELSRVAGAGLAAVHALPLVAEAGGVRSAVGLFAGAAAVHTVDDLSLVQVDSPAAIERERQVHAAFCWGVTADASHGPVGFRARLEEWRYREQFADTDARRRPLWFGADFVWWLL